MKILVNIKQITIITKEVNKANNQWLRKIAKRTFEKSLWNYSNRILTYLPIFNKNQRNLQQILIDAYETSKKCSKCGNYIEFISNNEIYCKHCNRHKNSIWILQEILQEKQY